jgi:hypothetical protein
MRLKQLSRNIGKEDRNMMQGRNTPRLNALVTKYPVTKHPVQVICVVKK